MKVIKIGVRKATAARVKDAIRCEVNIPVEIVKELGLTKGDTANIWVEGKRIIIEKIEG